MREGERRVNFYSGSVSLVPEITGSPSNQSSGEQALKDHEKLMEITSECEDPMSLLIQEFFGLISIYQ